MKYTQYTLRVKPAIRPSERHKISKVLQKMGYHFIGGETNEDMSVCDISFESTDLTEHEKTKVDKEITP